MLHNAAAENKIFKNTRIPEEGEVYSEKQLEEIKAKSREVLSRLRERHRAQKDGDGKNRV